MNIYSPQVEKKSQVFSYLLAAFAIITMMLLVLSFSHFFEHRLSVPSTSSQMVHTESPGVPVAIPAPMPPQGQIQMSVTSLSSPGANPVPQVVPIPTPSVQ